MTEENETYKAQILADQHLYGDAESRMLAVMASAVEACESLLNYAKDAFYAANNGDWERAADQIKKAEGYGYFDDGYHYELIAQHIRELKKKNNRNEF